MRGNREGGGGRPILVRAAAFAAGSLLLATAALGLAPASPAAARCVSPNARHEVGTFDRGGTLLVEGEAFGDECYDTGPPPDGEGVLGKPQRAVSVFVVQGGEEHLVAEGDADAAYEFAVDVVLPAALEPGEADVVVRSADGVEAADPDLLPFTVSEVPPPDPAADTEVAAFGPAAPEPEVVQVPGDGEGDSDGEGDGGEVTTRGGEGDPPLGAFVASGAIALAAVGVLVVLRKRQESIVDPKRPGADSGTEPGPPDRDPG